MLNNYAQRYFSISSESKSSIEISFSLKTDEVVFKKNGPFSRIILDGTTNTNASGDPSIPHLVFNVLVPKGYSESSFNIINQKTKMLDGEYSFLPEMNGIGIKPVDQQESQITNHDKIVKEVFNKNFPKSSVFKQNILFPLSLLEKTNETQLGPYRILTFRVNPIQYLPTKKKILLTNQFNMKVNFVQMKNTVTVKERDQRQLRKWHDLVKGVVLNPKSIGKLKSFKILQRDGLIILTNRTMKKAFEKLGVWKRSIGWDARVVTIEDIETDHYGTNADARDTEERVRNFIKWAYTNWDITHLIIGGDTEIIPMRGAAAVWRWNWFTRDENFISPDPPEEGRWKLHTLAVDDGEGNITVVNVSVLYLRGDDDVNSTTFFMKMKHGIKIPYSENPNNDELHWYFASDENYNDICSHYTCYVVIRGDQFIDQLGYFYINEGTSPTTDFYYSSFGAETYDVPGLHDWDKMDQNLYGYYNDEDNPSGIDFTRTSLATGRIPCATEHEATGCVNKIIRYESFNGMDNEKMKRAIIAADYDTYPTEIIRDSVVAIYPDINKFVPNNGIIYIRYNFGAYQGEHNLIAVDGIGSSNETWREIEYNVPESTDMEYLRDTNNLGGWFYSWQFDPIGIAANDGLPAPSGYIIIWGYEGSLVHDLYRLDNIGLDYFADEAESIKRVFREIMPNINKYHRLYRDVWSAPPIDQNGDILEFLDNESIVNAFNIGAAVATLHSHGDPEGLSQFETANAMNLLNNSAIPVTFGSACATLPFETENLNNLGLEAIGESMVLNPHGGSIAYFGFSKLAHSAYILNLEQKIWRALFPQELLNPPDTLGNTLNSGRLKLLLEDNTAHPKWHYYGLNLAGDPSIHPWLSSPIRINMSIEFKYGNKIFNGNIRGIDVKKITIHVKLTTEDETLIENGMVVVMDNKEVLFSERTDSDGKVIIMSLKRTQKLLPQPINLISKLTITASKVGYIPVQKKINNPFKR